MILPDIESPTNKDYVDKLNSYLLDAHSRGRTTALIIDEAQNLEPEVLEQLRLLTNLETNTHKLLRIILIGQPELRKTLEKEELSQVNQRITSRYHITALQPEDVRNYIFHRLAVAGNDSGRLFSEKAVSYVAKRTRGVPRLINLLCDRAMLGAYAENNDLVDIKTTKRAAEEIFTEPHPQPFFSKPRLFKLAVLPLTGLLFVAYIYYIGGRERPGNNLQSLEEKANVAARDMEQANVPAPQIERQNEEPPEAPTNTNRIKITPTVRLSTFSDYMINRDTQAAEQE